METKSVTPLSPQSQRISDTLNSLNQTYMKLNSSHGDMSHYLDSVYTGRSMSDQLDTMVQHLTQYQTWMRECAILADTLTNLIADGGADRYYAEHNRQWQEAFDIGLV